MFRHQFDKVCSADNVLSLSLTFFSLHHGTQSGQSNPNFFAMNCPISTILTVEYFLELILLIYCFKRVNFPSENGIFES